MRSGETVRRLLPGLVLAAVAVCCGGCIDLIARAIVDPEGLVEDLGREIAANEVRSLFDRQELDTLAQAEQTLADLRELIAQNPDLANADHLRHLADTLEEDLSEFEGQRPEPKLERGRLYNEEQGVAIFNATTGPERREGRLWAIELPDNPESRPRSRDFFRPVLPGGHALLDEPVDPRVFGLNDVEFLHAPDARRAGDGEIEAVLGRRRLGDYEIRRRRYPAGELPERGFIGEPREINTGARRPGTPAE